ncbi:MAG TPA: DNA cytosine methyltransferase [Symbiobacteriaceae bacterium]
MKVVDLFAGAGGFSQGFHDAGFAVAAAVEVDAWACDTLRLNHPNTRVWERDIRAFGNDEIARHLCFQPEVIIGGPPCQGFSLSVSGERRDEKDPRNSLFIDYVRFVHQLQPHIFVMENVKGLLTAKTAAGVPVIAIIRQCFEDIGYHVHVQVLHAADYGVPQIRERVFVFGSKRLDPAGLVPAPTHRNRQLASDGERTLRNPWVTLWDAISDLPLVDVGCEPAFMAYTNPAQNDYQALMRQGSTGVHNHQPMKHSRRLIERFQHVGFGQSGADVPDEHQARKRGTAGVVTRVYEQNNRRPHPDRPAHTIAASFYANFLHPYLHRNLTVREGARIQSFPDAYVFQGRKTTPSRELLKREGRLDDLHLCQYNQVGNAVPPLLARAIAQSCKQALDRLESTACGREQIAVTAPAGEPFYAELLGDFRKESFDARRLVHGQHIEQALNAGEGVGDAQQGLLREMLAQYRVWRERNLALKGCDDATACARVALLNAYVAFRHQARYAAHAAAGASLLEEFLYYLFKDSVPGLDLRVETNGPAWAGAKYSIDHGNSIDTDPILALYHEVVDRLTPVKAPFIP